MFGHIYSATFSFVLIICLDFFPHFCFIIISESVIFCVFHFLPTFPCCFVFRITENLPVLVQ